MEESGTRKEGRNPKVIMLLMFAALGSVGSIGRSGISEKLREDFQNDLSKE